jgi:cellulose synthase/poly-beta-1,6-N-acetylglucosamine synthase-like glycosyltransferase
VVARSESDVPEGVVPASARLILAGQGEAGAGEKINNLRAGLRAARLESEVVAFADSDGRVGKRWLRALVMPLRDAGIGASTGYRWHLPDPPDFWSLLRSVWNAGIAGHFGPGEPWFAWGGAMAIRRETLVAARVDDYWRGSVSDDYGLTAAVRAAGLRIAYAPGALVASVDHTDAGEFMAWIRRQMTITRVYRARLWWQALAAHIFYCGAMVASLTVALRGNLLGEYVLVAQLSLGMLKGASRAGLARLALPEYQTWFKRYGWVHTWWVPLATWMWLYSLIASAWSNQIEWRGNRYRLKRIEPPRG